MCRWGVTHRCMIRHPLVRLESRVWRYLNLNKPIYVVVDVILRISAEKKFSKSHHVIEKSIFWVQKWWNCKLHKIFDCVEFWVDLSRAVDFFSHFNLELRNEREKKSTAQENGDKMVTKLRQKIDKKIVLSVCLSKWTNYWNDFHGKNKSRIHFRGIF